MERLYQKRGQYQGDLCIENGVISQIGTHLEPASEEEARVIDAAGKYVLPGGVDVHTPYGPFSRIQPGCG